MEIILNNVNNNTDLTGVSKEVFLIACLAWLLQKSLMSTFDDISSEIGLNMGRVLPDIFNVWKIEIYSSMSRYIELMRQAYLAFVNLYTEILLPNVENGIIHPQIQELKIIFQHLVFTHTNVMSQTENFYRAFGSLQNPTFIRNYNQYMQVLQELNEHKQAMVLESQQSMDLIIHLLEPLQTIWN